LLTAQATFDLGHQVIGHAQLLEGLVEGFDIALSLSLLVLMAFFGIETTTRDGFDWLFGVWSGWGHGDVLRLRESR
jgi:hypothetical protein